MRTPISRISCTIPADLLAAADRMARQEQRPRSWVIAEALRHLLEKGGSTPSPGLVREPTTRPDAGEVMEAARVRRLQPALRVSPEERLAQAEALGAKERGARPRRLGASVISFDALLDHAAWQAANRRHA